MRFASSRRRSSRSSSPVAMNEHKRVCWSVAMALSIFAVFLLTNIFLESKLEELADDDIKNPLSLPQLSNSDHPADAVASKQDDAEDDDVPVTPAEVARLRSILDPLRVPALLSPPGFTDYDIYNCPSQPPQGYPFEWKALQVLKHWGIDDTNIPKDYIHQGLCVFDYPDERIRTYRRAELPFVLRQHPQVGQTAARWSTPGYLEQLLGEGLQRNEHSNHTNHFMFWRPVPGMPHADDPPPTDTVQLSYHEWLQKARALDDTTTTTTENQLLPFERWYLRLNGERHSKTNLFLYDELPFFRPSKTGKEKLFMVEPRAERGINCRFGMKGIFAESHFDPTRNWVVVLGGQRRYLLSHPRECPHLELYPANHPSGRHSSVNWSNPPEDGVFAQTARMNEVVLQAGDALYMPTNWFHAIVSLNTNYQCNARSGVTSESFRDLVDCGFGGFGPPHHRGNHVRQGRKHHIMGV